MEYSFNTEHAKLYGVNEAIMLKNFQFWIRKNKANKNANHDGRTWTYNSTIALTELFGFWSTGQIKRILKSLEEQNVLMVGNYNKAKYDRTKWYAFVDESAFIDTDNTISRNQPMEHTEPTNAIAHFSQPIPDVKHTDSKPDSKNIYYKHMLSLYDSFCLKEFDAPCKINGMEGNALKQIITYLIKVCQNKGMTEDKCTTSFEYILNNWDKLDDFTRKQIKLSQINSNITNIINQLKNGKATQTKSLAEDILAKYR